MSREALIEKLEAGSPKVTFTFPENIGYAAGYKDAFDIIRQHTDWQPAEISLIQELHEAMVSEAGVHYLESDLGERVAEAIRETARNVSGVSVDDLAKAMRVESDRQFPVRGNNDDFAGFLNSTKAAWLHVAATTALAILHHDCKLNSTKGHDLAQEDKLEMYYRGGYHNGYQAGREGHQWLPISTAPRDGTLIIAAWAGSQMYPIISRWLKNAEAWTHPFNKPVNEPTHWMPLPAPPKPE